MPTSAEDIGTKTKSRDEGMEQGFIFEKNWEKASFSTAPGLLQFFLPFEYFFAASR